MKQRAAGTPVIIRARVEDVREWFYVRGSTEVHDGYLLHEWVPLLGADQYVLVVTLRELFREQQEAQRHNQTVAWPTQEELARRCGVSPKTLKRWFAEQRAAAERGASVMLDYFVRVIPDASPSHDASGRFISALTYEVRLSTPLTPADQTRVSQIASDDQRAALTNPHVQNTDALFAFHGPITVGQNDPRSTEGQNDPRFAGQNDPRFVDNSPRSPQVLPRLSTGYPQHPGQIGPRWNAADPPLARGDAVGIVDKMTHGANSFLFDHDYYDDDLDLIKDSPTENEGVDDAGFWERTVAEEIDPLFNARSANHIPWERIHIGSGQLDALRAMLCDELRDAATMLAPQAIAPLLGKIYMNIIKQQRKAHIANPVGYVRVALRAALVALAERA